MNEDKLDRFPKGAMECPHGISHQVGYNACRSCRNFVKEEDEMVICNKNYEDFYIKYWNVVGGSIIKDFIWIFIAILIAIIAKFYFKV